MIKTTVNDLRNPNTQQRPYTGRELWRAMGRVKLLLDCPFCQAQVEAYKWSLCGSGKRCDCGALFYARGIAYKLMQPES